MERGFFIERDVENCELQVERDGGQMENMGEKEFCFHFLLSFWLSNSHIQISVL